MGDSGGTTTDPNVREASQRSTAFIGREREVAELSGASPTRSAGAEASS